MVLGSQALAIAQGIQGVRKAIFLDRDGTVIEEAEYLSDPARLKLLPEAARALRLLKDAGFLLVVVTNQSGVARGYFNLETVELLNDTLNERLSGEGVAIDRFYVCPHHPEITGECGCRKPMPGMLQKAAAELDVDLSASWMVGDKACDIEAGLAAGVKTALVLTGYGQKEEAALAKKGTPPTVVAKNLYHFSQTALAEEMGV